LKALGFMRKMNKTDQIITIHLVVLLTYTLILAIWAGAGKGEVPYLDSLKWLGFMFIQAIMMAGHCVTIMTFALTPPKDFPEYAQAHWIGLLFVLLIGGSMCFILPGMFSNLF